MYIHVCVCVCVYVCVCVCVCVCIYIIIQYVLLLKCSILSINNKQQSNLYHNDK